MHSTRKACARVAAMLIAGAVRAVAQGVTAFVDVSVIPMDRERVLENHTVVVAAGKISALGPSAAVRPPAGSRIVDGRGKYLIPGLGDAHAHLSTPGGGTALAERALSLFALNGVTMIRSMYTEPHHRAAVARVERGELLGPRTLLVSPALTGQTVPTPSAGRDSVRAFSAAGYPVIKILPGISRASFDTIALEARRLKLPLAGHVPAEVGLDVALASGYVSLEHLDGFIEALAPPGTAGGFFGFAAVATADESRIAAVVAAVKSAGVTVVPTELEMELYVSGDTNATSRFAEAQFAPRELVDQWRRQQAGTARVAAANAERVARYRELRRLLVKRLYEGGVPIGVGSDAFNLFDVAGFGTFRELETLVASGLRPFDALHASTGVAARLIGLERDAGVVATGRVGDLILLDANPLVDISNVRRQSGVMLRGRWLPASEIAGRLGELAAPR